MAKLCIIPAREGSKRIPKKNIKIFCGKPIILYSIEAALKSDLFDKVMVSTDSYEIAQIANKAGAEVPFLRSEKSSNDLATTLEVIKEVLEEFKKLNEIFEFVCCLYATAPMVQIEDLKQGFIKLKKFQFNTVLPVTQFSFPIWRSFKIAGENLEMFWPENENTRSQDLEPAFHDAGQWYWTKTASIGEQGLYKNASYILLDSNRVQDIDTVEDWETAERKYLKING